MESTVLSLSKQNTCLHTCIWCMYILVFVLCSRIAGSLIRCVSGGFGSSNATAMGPVEVFIDNAVLNTSGVEFEFRDDPVYTAVSPQSVIPA